MLTLFQLFGGNALQNGQVLVIAKSDLPLLIASINNSPESLLVAILLKALDNFSDEIRDSNNQPILDSSNSIILANGELYDELKVFRWNNAVVQRNGRLFIRKTLVIEIYEDVSI